MVDVSKYMPRMLVGKELDDAMKVFPEYDSKIREKSVTERLIALQDIYRLYIPSQMTREIYSKVYFSILRSLQKKQSILAVRQHGENSKMIRQQSYESIIGGADSFLIIGDSGIGKSSAISRAVNILLEEPVWDTGYSKIIPALLVQTPADASIKGLLLEVLRKVDEVLGTRYHDNAVRSRSTTDMLIGTVNQVSLNHIGLLITDEIQNVVTNKNGRNLIGTFSQLINSSGISLAMLGTNISSPFFESEMMLARRSLGLNYSAMQYDDEFRVFCKIILTYLYVKEDVEINEELILWLYNHSLGNASVLMSLIHDSQEIAIMEGIEKLTVSTLNMAYEKRLFMLHNYIYTEPKKASTVKKKKEQLPNMRENVNTENSSILEISKKAKELGKDIVSELRKNGIQILEVDI